MPGKVRTERIAVRVTPELRAAIARCAAREHRTVSNWIEVQLAALVAAADKPPKR